MVWIAILPIVLLIFLLTKRNSLPSYKALWITAALTYLLSLTVFRRDPLLVHAAVLDGFLTSWTPIAIIWGAIFLFESLEAGGGMGKLRGWLNGVSDNRIAQLMIVGWAFPFLIEGASGFGTPAALAAPILVGLGFPPLRVAVMALIMNSVPVSFGAVGTPTWFGFSEIANLSVAEIGEIGLKSAILHGAAALFVPVAALSFVVKLSDIRRNAGFIALSVAATVIPYIAVAAVDYEFPSLVGGFVGLAASVVFARLGWGLRPIEPAAESVARHRAAPGIAAAEIGETRSSGRELIWASFPIWGTVLLLLITRINQLGIKALITSVEGGFLVPIGTLGEFGISRAAVLRLNDIFGTDERWSHQLLYVPSLVPFVLISLIYLRKGRLIRSVFARSFERMKYPALALFAALIFVNLMMAGGTASAVALIGTTLAAAVGTSWQLFAPLLGAVGSFFSGSNTVSNLTFGAIQDAAARDLGLNRTTILALQSVGGALGNMVCINNIVAVASVLGLERIEGYALKRTVLVALAYALVAGSLSYLFFLLF